MKSMVLRGNFILTLLSLCLHCAAISQSYDNFRLSPSHPAPGQKIRIELNHNSWYPDNMLAFILFGQVNEKWPRAEESRMIFEDGKLTTYITPSTTDVSFMVIFIDSLGNIIDNNNDLGYWTALYHKPDEKIPGSLATIANMYYGVAKADLYKIKPNRDLARKLYADEFSEAPQLKRFYFPGYLASIRYEKEPDRWLRELNEFASQNDLTDWDLLKISMNYRLIKDTANANKYFKLIKVMHPQGEYALQTLSAQYQERYLKCNTAKDRMRIYAEHRSEFSTWPMNENKSRSLGTTNMVYLLRDIEDYITESKLNEWKSNMALLSERTKYLGYMYAAQRLADKNIFLDVAQDLIEEATAWSENTLFSPRTYIDWSYLSEREYILIREKDLADWLYIYEQILRLQNKNAEARLVAEKARRYAEHQSLKIKRRPPVKLINVPSPEITFLSKKQIELTPGHFKGKTVVLDFWASWCGPCIEGFKQMNRLQKQFSGDSVAFFYVNTMEKGDRTEIQKNAKKILHELQYPFEVLYDFKNRSPEAFGFTAIPSVVVIDKKGSVRFIRTGADDQQLLEEVLEKLKTED